ncbi:MAG: HNH endonuclease [Burkholderiales bacterium]|nr:HNH endonuclease [Burkholderiales bacterium]
MTVLSGHPFLIETHCGGTRNFDSIEEFLEAYDDGQVKIASVLKKRELSAIRRREFSLRRPEIELALIQRDGYVCAEPDRKVTSDLTIDHIVPLSKGGTDELSNLRFLCRSHNSAKGDK